MNPFPPTHPLSARTATLLMRIDALQDDSTANYLHQLVYRREGDWGNTRYWEEMTGLLGWIVREGR